MSDWPTAPLSGALDLLIDHRGKTPRKLRGDWASTGVRVISAINIKEGRVDNENLRFVDRGLYGRWMPVALRHGDVLLTSEAPLGEVAFWASDGEAALGQRLFALRANEQILHGRYLYYWLTSAGAQSQLHGRATGTTVGGIRQSELVKVQVPLPPLAEQRSMAETLGAIDDKIDSNSRAITAVDQTVRTLCALATRRAIDSGTSRRATLASLVSQVRKAVTPREASGRPYVGLEHMPRGRLFVDDWGVGDSVASNKWSFEPSDILFGKLRPYFKKVGIASVAGVCSTDILVLRPVRTELRPITFAVLASDEVIDFASSGATGTKMPRASWGHLCTWATDLPSDSAIVELNGLALPMLAYGSRLVLESRALAALRVALLPELISGRLRVPEAAERVEGLV